MNRPDRDKTRPGTTRRVRLKDYDYSTPGYYFITICTHDRQDLFGEIDQEQMHLSAAGEMVRDTILECSRRFKSVEIDCFVVMPNHVHILLGLAVRLDDDPGIENVKDVVQWFKSSVHQRFRSGVHHRGWPPYQQKIWQTGYHDHIVRNDRELETLRLYVAKNVESWRKDRFYDHIL